MPRLFIAIDLPDYVKEELAALQRNDIRGARRTTRDQMHITLHFIGEVDAAMQNQLMAALPAVQIEPFELTLRNVGHFPPKGKVRVLWAGVEIAPQLQTLHQTIGGTLQNLGIKIEERVYNPHVTLARLKINPSRRAIQSFLDDNAQFRTVPFRVDEFALYSSQLTSQGAIYTKELIVSTASAGN